jgi:hypothetical protein
VVEAGREVDRVCTAAIEERDSPDELLLLPVPVDDQVTVEAEPTTVTRALSTILSSELYLSLVGVGSILGTASDRIVRVNSAALVFVKPATIARVETENLRTSLGSVTSLTNATGTSKAKAEAWYELLVGRPQSWPKEAKGKVLTQVQPYDRIELAPAAK